MTGITITIKFGNAACRGMQDVPHLLRELAYRISDGQEPTKVMDINGQCVGKVEYE